MHRFVCAHRCCNPLQCALPLLCWLPLSQLRAIMHAFVTKMLESSTFNKLLSGARECHKMLRIASNNWKEPYQREVLQVRGCDGC